MKFIKLLFFSMPDVTLLQLQLQVQQLKQHIQTSQFHLNQFVDQIELFFNQLNEITESIQQLQLTSQSSPSQSSFTDSDKENEQ